MGVSRDLCFMYGTGLYCVILARAAERRSAYLLLLRLQRPMGWAGHQSLSESVAIAFKSFSSLQNPFRMHLRNVISSPLHLPLNYPRVTMSGYRAMRDSTTLGRSSASSIELLHHVQAQTTFRLVMLAPIVDFATEV
jgi:hypothetical protein